MLRTYKLRHNRGVILLPKLRMQFAEFLNHSYLNTPWYSLPAHLCWFGVRAPRESSLAAFLGSMGSMTSPVFGSASCLRLYGDRIYLGPSLHTYPRTTIAWVHLTFLRPLIAFRCKGGSVRQTPKGYDIPLATFGREWTRSRGGTGISTSCASTTPLGLVLAPDSPWEE